MTATRRILHIINTAEVGGGGEHLRQLTQALRSLGFESVVAVGRSGPAADQLQRAGIRVVVLGAMGLSAPYRIAQAVRSIPHDLLHAHGSRSGLGASLGSRIVRLRPLVYTAHAFSFRRQSPAAVRWMFARAEALTCEAAARVICLTAADVRAAAAVGIRTDHFTVIPNGIDPHRFSAVKDRRADLGIAPDAPVVGLIARLVPQKDPVRFVHVASAVARAIPRARFLVVGDGPLRSAVERAVREQGLDSRVILTGFRSDVPELLATMDVVVLTSAWEGLPIAVLEAMAASRPVVAPALPGIDEVLEDRRTGVVVGDRDPASIAAGIERLLREPAVRAQMAEAARARVLQRFTVGVMATATADVYERVLRTQGASEWV